MLPLMIVSVQRIRDFLTMRYINSLLLTYLLTYFKTLQINNCLLASVVEIVLKVLLNFNQPTVSFS